ncbi:GNAT family N-acetyltransferase [Shewanella sp. 10N.286.45.A1]|uniref:GNAT family N-acetyltransferase n=1 Tax=Shewanella sp. 10N.286.45.A1 TaxID=3229694 RepID=UPI0035543943
MQSILISDDKDLLDLISVHELLSNEAPWAKGISFETVKVSVENSLCIGAYLNNTQVGFCRVITDYSTFGNLVDVIVWPSHRGTGISKLLMDAVMSHEKLSGLRRFTLASSNAQGLYSKFGFLPVANPEIFMERYNPDVYSKAL